MDIRQIRTALKLLIQKARKENKVFVHNKVRDKNGNPKPLTPEELEKELDNGNHVYPHEEWELVDPNISTLSLKMKAFTHEGNLESTIFHLQQQLKNKKES